MTENIYDAVIIGAGVIGLAVSRKLALEGKEILIIEEQGQVGSVTSSRNSGVIHAGVYYDKDSLKAKFCPEGNRSLRAFVLIPLQEIRADYIHPVTKRPIISLINDLPDEQEISRLPD